ncbi:alpha/beta fold hydrolase [Nocardia stercoris]|uniref:Alpha/beta hydrolase n=1 Tax=Nocardia stercoris TaxID=2483361 RepID=A0A3M2L5E9_9NOCA|nr:alpha/beta hydrolase [Nocardia stercoris]RMI32879.1 alpha/beta hydrolase [Nocardia stercoris]
MGNAGFRTAEIRAVHVVEHGPPDGRPVLLLHGWPQNWRAWTAIMELGAADGNRMIALDLPGIGGSAGARTDGSTVAMAETVHAVAADLELERYTLVGHDIGGMVGYSLLRAYPEIARAVVMDTVIPGIAPWDRALADPRLWHFGFHAVPGLPETLVAGHQRRYFDHIFATAAARPDAVTESARDSYAAAYGSDGALAAGFDWYRAFPADAAANTMLTATIATPLLYLRGDQEGGEIQTYARGFADFGIENVSAATVAGSGHFTPEENPRAVWQLITQWPG